MDISLIICTRNRSEQLSACLQSVCRITFEQPWELILVDNGSVDKTANVIQKFIETVSVPATYVFESAPGLANAHNAGLRAARGEIVAFTDDDCYPAEDFLAQLWAAFADPSVGYITGRITLHDPTDHPTSINESLSPRTFPPGSFLRSGWVQGANMAFRRQVLLDIGGFDPLFGPGSLFNAEDVDAAARAGAIGWSGQYCPYVVVRHHHGRKRSDLAPLLRSYALGRGAYHMKLLLNQRRFWWFARSFLYELWRWRVKWEPEAPLWETVGAAEYAYLHLSRVLRVRLTRNHASLTHPRGPKPYAPDPRDASTTDK
jgi:glycosyltransferase involved in cell wall biosynthesis